MVPTVRRHVFGYLADFSNIPKWNYAIEESRQSRGPKRVVTTIHQTRSIPRLSK